MDSTGVFPGKHRCTNPYVAWAPGEQRGLRGFILILGKILKFNKNYSSATRLETVLKRTKIIPKTPKNPVLPNARLRSPAISHTQPDGATPEPFNFTYNSSSTLEKLP